MERPEYGIHTSYRELPVGTKVKRPAIAPRTRLMGVSAIYGMTPCTEEVVRKAIESSISRRLIVLELPQNRQLAEPEEEDHTASNDLGEDYEFADEDSGLPPGETLKANERGEFEENPEEEMRG